VRLDTFRQKLLIRLFNVFPIAQPIGLDFLLAGGWGIFLIKGKGARERGAMF